MHFDRELTERVRDLLLDRGRLSETPLDERWHSVHEEDATPEQRAVLCRVAPMAEALYLVVSADGVCEPREHTVLRGAVRTVTDGALSDATIESLFSHFGDSLRDEGLDTRLGWVASQLAADRADSEVTLELAAAVIIADGVVAPLEKDALERLAEQTGTNPDQALALLG